MGCLYLFVFAVGQIFAQMHIKSYQLLQKLRIRPSVATLFLSFARGNNLRTGIADRGSEAKPVPAGVRRDHPRHDTPNCGKARYFCGICVSSSCPGVFAGANLEALLMGWTGCCDLVQEINLVGKLCCKTSMSKMNFQFACLFALQQKGWVPTKLILCRFRPHCGRGSGGFAHQSQGRNECRTETRTQRSIRCCS